MSFREKLADVKKQQEQKVAVGSVRIERPARPKKSPDFIGWAKKGKDASCT